MVRVVLHTIVIVTVGVVGCSIFLYRSPLVVCTSIGLSGGAFSFLLLLEIWLEDSGPQSLLSGEYLSIVVCGPRMGPF